MTTNLLDRNYRTIATIPYSCDMTPKQFGEIEAESRRLGRPLTGEEFAAIVPKPAHAQ